ncbi:MAG TPA: hypothetical protein VGJ44_14270 [Kribbellaceae bacterium]|jgi:hypothetical protein
MSEQSALDQELRAARERIRHVEAALRQALEADERIAGRSATAPLTEGDQR